MIKKLLSASFFFVALALPAVAATTGADEYIETDVLGYTCVQEDNLEAAMQAGGKGIRLPQTCVIDPCTSVTKEMFDNFFAGTETDSMRYDAFLRRQDAQCPVDVPRARFSDHDLLAAIFNGATVTTWVDSDPVPQVPIPAGAVLLATAVGSIALYRRKRQ